VLIERAASTLALGRLLTGSRKAWNDRRTAL